MVNQRHYHRLTFPIAGVLTLLIFVIGSLQIASAQNRIISLSGDLDFGRIPFGASAQRTLTISNAGDSVLTISNVIFPPVPVWGQSSFQANWSGPIEPGGSEDVVITFTPTEFLGMGSNDLDFQGYLTVNSDATSGSNYAFMSGVGTWPPLTPGANLDYGTVPIGTINGKILMLTNIGTVPVTVSNIFVPGGFVAGFSATIAPGTGEYASVLFEPSAVTNYAGIGSISSDATDPALVVITPNGNITNSPIGINAFSVSGTGAYPSGKFEGLFMSTNNPAFESSGYFTADTTNGNLRATITLAGKRYPFSARVSPFGTATATIARKKLPALNVSLQFGGFNAAWFGTIDDGTWTAELNSERAFLISKNPPRAIPPGKYTINLIGSTNASVGPTATGIGTIALSLTDVTRLTGVLGDASRFSQNTVLCAPPPSVPFYASLYGNRGAILGWIAFLHEQRPPPQSIPQTSPQLQIVGTLHWFKPAGIDRDYPDGFSIQTTVSGSVP